MRWLYELKLLAVDMTGLEKDALHIYVALIVFVAANLVFRWKARSGKALLVVLIVALGNEVADIRYNMQTEDNPYLFSSLHDVVNTMLLPIFLVILARWTGMFERTVQKISSDEA